MQWMRAGEQIAVVCLLFAWWGRPAASGQRPAASGQRAAGRGAAGQQGSRQGGSRQVAYKGDMHPPTQWSWP